MRENADQNNFEYGHFLRIVKEISSSWQLKVLRRIMGWMDIHFFQESMVFKLQIGSKKCKFLLLYCWANQSKDEFDKFIENLELTFDTLY